MTHTSDQLLPEWWRELERVSTEGCAQKLLLRGAEPWICPQVKAHLKTCESMNALRVDVLLGFEGAYRKWCTVAAIR